MASKRFRALVEAVSDAAQDLAFYGGSQEHDMLLETRQNQLLQAITRLEQQNKELKAKLNEMKGE